MGHMREKQTDQEERGNPSDASQDARRSPRAQRPKQADQSAQKAPSTLQKLAGDLKQLRLRHLGFAFFFAWMSMFMHGPQLILGARDGGAQPVMTEHASFVPLATLTIASALTMLFYGIARSVRPPISLRTRTRACASALIIVGTILSSLSVATGTWITDLLSLPASSVSLVASAMASAASTIAGVGMAKTMVMWGEFYGCIGSRRASVYICASVFLSSALYYLTAYLSPAPRLFAICLYPVLSMALLTKNQPEIGAWYSSSLGQENEPGAFDPSGPRRNPLPAKILVCAALYGAVSGLVAGSSLIFDAAASVSGSPQAQQASSIDPIAGMVVAVLLLLGIALFGSSIDRGFTYRPTILIMVAGCALLPFAGGLHGQIATAIVGGGYMFFYALSWILYSDIAYRAKIPGHRVFSWGRVAGAGGYAAGMAVSAACSQMLGFEVFTPTLVAFITMGLLVLTAVFVLDEKDVLSGWGKLRDIGPEKAGQQAPDRAHDAKRRQESPDAAISRAFADQQLTKREREILIHLLKGRSLPRIGEDLGIAYTTVNSHVASIYAKCGVHSRQELIDMAEALVEQTDGELYETRRRSSS